MYLNAFYRLDDDRPPAELADVERRPGAYVDHLLRRLESAPSFNDRDFYDFHLRIQCSRGWRNLDPSDEPFASNAWGTLRSILTRLDMRVFDPHEPVLPPPGPWQQRYNLTWGVEPGGILRVRRRVLDSSDPELMQLFRLLVRDRTPEAALPETLLREARRLDPVVREEVDAYPLRELALEARDLLERLVILHHHVYFKTIDAVMAKFTVREPSEACLGHLANEFIQSLDRVELRDRIREKYPEFEFHATLRERPFAVRRERQAPAAPATVTVEQAPAVTLVVGALTFTEMPYPGSLQKVLSFIRCHLRFHRFAITGDLATLDQEKAAAALVEIDELAGTWGERRVSRPDPDRFWKKEVWIPGAGGGRVSLSMDSLRYALYDPPYGGASEREIALFETEILDTVLGPGQEPSRFNVWSIDPKGSEYFINEWWDYCWVLFNVGRREALVLYGTATD